MSYTAVLTNTLATEFGEATAVVLELVQLMLANNTNTQKAKTYPYPHNLAKFRPSDIRPVSMISAQVCALRAQNCVLILETGRIFEGRNLAKFRG